MRLRELKKNHGSNQPFETEDVALMEMQELLDFLKQDSSVRDYLKKTLYDN